MRNSFTVDRGLKLARSPSARQQTLSRWLAVLGALALLALAGGVVGALTGPHAPDGPAVVTGPFSYFPS